MEVEDLVLFAPPAEVMRAGASYNAALSQYVNGDEEGGLKRLLQICRDYPLFAQAGHLSAILLAAKGDFIVAETLLKRVRLLELSEEEAKQIDEELGHLRRETDRLKRERFRRRRREEMLNPVKAEIALRSILQKAPELDEPQAEDQKEAEWGSSPIFDGSRPGEQRKTIITAIIAISVAVFVLLLFFLLIRPRILKSQEQFADRNERLSWLEARLEEEAPNNQELAILLAKYQAWLEAGKPTATTVQEENSSAVDEPAVEDEVVNESSEESVVEG